MEQNDEDVRITIKVPASLRKQLKVSAAMNDRSFSGEIIHCLKKGSGWAAGGDLGGQAPAAENNSTALERGESINNGKRSADDECASA